MSHHASTLLRSHLQTLRIPEGQPVPPRTPAESETCSVVVVVVVDDAVTLQTTVRNTVDTGVGLLMGFSCQAGSRSMV